MSSITLSEGVGWKHTHTIRISPPSMLCYMAHTHSLGKWLSVNLKDQNRRCKKSVYISKLEIRHTGHYTKTGFHLVKIDLNLFVLQKSELQRSEKSITALTTTSQQLFPLKYFLECYYLTHPPVSPLSFHKKGSNTAKREIF